MSSTDVLIASLKSLEIEEVLAKEFWELQIKTEGESKKAKPTPRLSG